MDKFCVMLVSFLEQKVYFIVLSKGLCAIHWPGFRGGLQEPPKGFLAEKFVWYERFTT